MPYILGEFELRYIKSESKQVTVCCQYIRCNWRLHASRLYDVQTFQVKTVRGEYTCSSVNKCGNSIATKRWIAGVVEASQ